jgi:uroporphyrinogen-III decarboxylase
VPNIAHQVFDSWGGELTKVQFEEFSLPYLARIAKDVKANVAAAAAQVKGLPARVPMTVFARLAHFAIEALGGTEYDVLSLDWCAYDQSPSVLLMRVVARDCKAEVGKVGEGVCGEVRWSVWSPSAEHARRATVPRVLALQGDRAGRSTAAACWHGQVFAG